MRENRHVRYVEPQAQTACRLLTDDELTGVAGGDTKPTAPAPKPHSSTLFEMEDYSFDIEQVL